jgi:MtrB/PioB family decaheme-associated outer membrane protein
MRGLDMQSHISMSRALRTALLAAAGALLGLPGGTIADTDLGPVTASGEIELGYQGVGDDWSSAKFEQYRDESPGLIARGLFLLEDEEATRFFRGWFDQLTRDDQEYLFQAGRYGRYRLEFGLSQFYQTFSNNALTPYGSPGEETRLVLPPGFALSSPFDRDNMETQLSTFSFNPELRFRQRNYTTGISLWATPELLLRSDYELRDRDGTRPHALGFGSAGGRFVNFRAPVDDHTNNWSGDILLLRERWNLEFDYSGSSYDNDADSVTLESPFTPTVPLGDTTQGRISRDPDNTLHQFSLSGSTELPGEMPARLAGTLSYGRLTQDESFLPHSANPAPGAANPPLPQSDLDGKVNTLLGNLVLTARPRTDLNLKARYRYYDYDNETDTIVFEERVRNDAFNAQAGVVAEQRDYRRQTASLEATHRLSRQARLTAEYEWDNWYREDRQVTHLNDHAGRLTVDYRPLRSTRLRASYEFRTRDGNDYDPGTTDPGLRIYDVADRVRQDVELFATLIPTEALAVTLTGGFSDSDFDNEELGLDDQVSWSAGIDAGYRVTERVALTAFYTFDRTRWTQDGSNWRARSTDSAHDVGVTVDLMLMPESLDLQLSWQYHWGKAETRTNGLGASDYPSIKDNLQVFSAMFEYRLLEKVRLKWGYRFERFNGTDFKFDDLGLIPPIGITNDVFMSDNVDDYRASIFLTSLVYEF